MIPGHLLWWGACAVLLFWAVGAYNRLVRLRSEALRSFTPLGLQLQRFTDHVVALASTDAGLHGATTQFAASLAVARLKPLDAETMAALGAACAVLCMAWQRAAEEEQAAPEPVISAAASLQWTDLLRQAEPTVRDFAAAVGSYNAAVGQFPAAVLAWLFGFHQAAALALPSADTGARR